MRSGLAVKCVLLALTTILSLLLPASAEPIEGYDEFAGPLSPALWVGLETNTNFAVISNTETRRAVVQPDPLVAKRFLQLGLTSAHLGSGSDTGVAGEGRQRLRVGRDDIIAGDVVVTGFHTKVVMLSAAVTPCPTTTDASPTRAMAHVVFVFFNDGSSTGPTDATGDVFAGFNVERSSTFGKIITAFIAQCANPSCSILANLGKAQTFTRRWAIGVPVPLVVAWDRFNDRFFYTSGTEQHVLTYGDIPLTAAAPPVRDVRDLSIRNVLPNCSTPVRAAAGARYDFMRIGTETGVFP
jgi:hypothetical protein